MQGHPKAGPHARGQVSLWGYTVARFGAWSPAAVSGCGTAVSRTQVTPLLDSESGVSHASTPD